MIIEQQFLDHFRNVRRVGPRAWCARCPGHDGTNEFLNIARGDQEFRVYCREGCRRAEVLQAHALTDRDLLIDGDGDAPRGAGGQQSGPAQSRMLEAALDYAERGAPVFPVWSVADGRCQCGVADCTNAGKHPLGALVPHGLKEATTDPAIIRRWWARYPGANIATVTSWCTVLDVDPRAGGDVALAGLEQQHGALPDTCEVLTGGGGRHLYFALVPGLAPSASAVAAGIDVKSGAGAYVLLPPSSHASGGRYADELAHPLFEGALAAMPAWLVALALAPVGGNGHHHGEAPDWAALLAGAPEGQRRSVALRIAGHYLGKGIPPAEVEEILLGFAARCAPPFEEDELRARCESRTSQPRARRHLGAGDARRRVSQHD